MELDYKAIGIRIRKLRKNAGLSQEQFAEQVNISVQHVSHIETANTKLSLPLLVHIANALHVTPNDLLCDSVDQAKPTYLNEISKLLETCTIEEVRIVTEIADATVSALHKKN